MRKILIFYSFIFLSLTSCMKPTDKGSVSLDLGNFATSAANQKALITNIEIQDDELVVTGSKLNSISQIQLTGNSINQILTIISQTNTRLILSSGTALGLVLNSAFDLIFTDAHGAAVISVTFNVADSSISTAKIGDDQVTTAKIVDGAITGTKLNSMGAGNGQVLKYNGTTWIASDLGALIYAGGWDASTATAPNVAPSGGEYYIVTTADTAIDIGDGSGARNWALGDWIIFNSVTSMWDKIDNASSVTSFDGRSGAVVPTTGDYTWAQIDKTTSPIGDLSNVDVTGAVLNSVLKFDGTNWIVGSDNDSSGAGAVSNATDSTLNADSDGNGSGDLSFQINSSEMAAIKNNGDFIVDTDTFVVDASANKVGVGVLAPTYDLSFSGNADKAIGAERHNTTDTAGSDLFLLAAGATAAATDKDGGDLYLASGTATGTGSSSVFIQTATAQGATATTDNAPTTKMTILGNGNIGIGTVNPTQKVHIYQSTGEINQFIETGDTSVAATRYINSASHWRTGIQATDDFIIREIAPSTGNHFMIQTGGNVGIGTTNPGSKLTIDNGDIKLNSNATYIRSTTSSAGDVRMLGINSSDVAYIGPIDSGPVASIFNVSSSSLISTFYTAGSERIRISSTGNVGIGTTSPSSTLDINANLSTALTGTVDITAGTTVLTGTGTAFDTELAVGDAIKIGTEIFTVSAITNATSLTLDSNHIAGATAATATSDPTILSLNTGDDRNLLSLDKSGLLNLNGILSLQESTGSNTISIKSPTTIAASYSLTLPDNDGNNGEVLTTDGSGVLSWAAAPAATSVAASTGNVGSPSISFSGDANTGFYSFGVDQIGVSSNGSNTFNFTTTALTSPTTGGASITTGNGTAAAPTYSFAGDTDTGWFRAADNELGAATVGTERVRIDSSGNLGIGTSTPSNKLEVAGGVTVSKANSQIIIKDTDNVSGEFSYLERNGSGLKLGVNDGTTSLIGLTILDDGKVGIGTTSPTGLLEVSGSSSGTSIGNNGTGAFLSNTDATTNNWSILNFTDGSSVASAGVGVQMVDRTNHYGEIGFATRSADGWNERMRIGKDGSVGIGTSSPVAKLHISSADLGTTLNNTVEMQRLYSSNGNEGYLDFRHIRTSTGVNWSHAATRIQKKIDSTWMGYLQFNGTGNNGGLSFGTGLTTTAPGNVSEAMRIVASGNVGIGTTTPAADLELGDVTSGYPGLKINGKNDNELDIAVPTGEALQLGHHDGTLNGGTTRLAFNSLGNVGIGTTSPLGTLDVNGSLSSSLTGTVDITAGTAAVTGTGTAFDTELAVGDAVKIGTETFTVSAITNATSLTLDSNHIAGATASSATSDPAILSLNTGDNRNLLSLDKSGLLNLNGILSLQESSGSDLISIRSPASIAASYSLTLPVDDGVNGQVLTTDGSGVLSWGAASSATSVAAGAGSAGSPSMSFSSDTNTGFYSNGADRISISNNGANTFNFTTTGLSSTTLGGAHITTGNGTATTPTYSFSSDGDTGWFRPAANELGASTGGSERVRIDNYGKVGIGTTTPSSKLDIVDSHVDNATKNALSSSLTTTTTVNTTSFDKATYSRLIEYNIPTGVTDSGYKVGVDASSYSANDAGFAGTLTNSYGAWARTGIYRSAPGSTITNAKAVYAELLADDADGTITNGYGVYIQNGTTNVTNNYGLYQTTTAAKNYFAGNVGIGTSTPTQGKLQVKQPADSSTNGITVTNAAASASFRMWHDSTNARLSSGATGTGTIVINNGGGNVGIGTITPPSNLTVNGSTGIYQRNSSGGRLVFDDTDVADASTPMSFLKGVDGNLSFGHANRNPANSLTTGSSISMTVKSTGRVGIGTEDPAAKLDISDNVKFLQFEELDGTANKRKYDFVAVDDQLRIRAINDSDSFVRDIIALDHDGNVGFGTTSPTEALHVVSQGNLDGIRIDNSTSQANTSLTFDTGPLAGNYEWRISAHGNSHSQGANKLSFQDGTIARMTIDSTGQVGIGTTSPETTLHVEGSLCVTSDDDCAVAPADGIIAAEGALLTGADYAEYFNSEDEDLRRGDLVGLNLESGKVRTYQSGDPLIGIVSTNPGVVGNSELRDQENTVLVALVGQVPFNNNQVKVLNGFAYTLDENPLGMILQSGDIYINISSVDGSQNRQIASLQIENKKIRAENQKIKQQLDDIKSIVCIIKPKSKICKD